MEKHEVVRSFEVECCNVQAPDGLTLPVIEIRFTTRSNPDDEKQQTDWPALRLTPQGAEALSLALNKELGVFRDMLHPAGP